MSGIFDQVLSYNPTILASSLAGSVVYKGTWDAATNSPTLANPPAATTKGWYYVVSVAGTQFSLDFAVGDWIISNGSVWQKVDLTDSVSSVFGRTGPVAAQTGDYTAAQITGLGSLATQNGTFSGTSSGTNTGDQTISITGDATASGSTGVLTATVTKINGTSLAGLATGILKNTTTTGVPSIAVAADFPTLNQNTTGTASNVTGTVALANGGTGATNAPDARMALGLGSLATQNGTFSGTSSGTNTGDQTISITGDVTASGSTGALTATVGRINGVALIGLGTGILKNSTVTGQPGIAVAADFPTLNQNTSGTASNVTGVVAVSNGGTGASSLTGYVKGSGTAALTANSTIPNTDVSGLGTMSTQNASSVAITGGSINNTPIGAAVANSGAFTTVTASTPIGTASGGTGVNTTPSNGQVLIGNGTGYTANTLTAGSGISITNTAGGINIEATGGTATEIVTATVTNAESTTITKGQVVYAFGATGNRMSVKLAYNTLDATSAKTIGVVSDASIAANGTGTITLFGEVTGLTLGSYADGDTLYLGATAGSITNVKPYAPNHLVYVGIVERANNGNGELYVKIQNGYELDEIHDVQITSAPASGALLVRDATNSLWKAARLTAGTNIAVTNADASVTVGITGVIAGTYGGTGVNNGANTITLAGNVTHAGAFTQSFTATANTSLTLPVTGTLATLAGSEALSNKTITASPISGSTGAFTTLSASGTTTIGTNAAAGRLIINGPSTASTGATLTGQFAGTDKFIIGTQNAIYGGTSANLIIRSISDNVLIGAAGTEMATFSSTGLAVTGALSATGTTTIGPNNTGTGLGLLQLLGGSGTNGGASVYFGTNGTAYSSIGQSSGILGGTTTDFVIYANNSGQSIKFYAGGGGLIGSISNTGLAVTGALSASGNLNFTGTGNRITGDFANATIANRVAFQNSTANSATVVNALPSGTGTASGFVAYNNSDPTNAALMRIFNTGTEGAIQSGINGTGSYLPMTFYTGGSERVRVDTSGNVGIGTTSPATKLDVVGTTVAFGVAATGVNITIREYSASTARNWSIRDDNGVNRLRFSRGSTDQPFWDVTKVAASDQTADQFWYTNGSQRMQLSSTGLSVTGALSCTGALSKGSGSFRIEHPLPEKSATHQLVHSFIEGPQADLIYRGKVVLIDGKASVNIDAAATMTEGTFEVLCRDVQCFTTNETGWTAVRGKVTGNILTIEAKDADCSDEISWMVIGERQDPHMMETDWTDDNGKVIVEPLKPSIEPIQNT